VLALV